MNDLTNDFRRDERRDVAFANRLRKAADESRPGFSRELHARLMDAIAAEGPPGASPRSRWGTAVKAVAGTLSLACGIALVAWLATREANGPARQVNSEVVRENDEIGALVTAEASDENPDSSSEIGRTTLPPTPAGVASLESSLAWTLAFRPQRAWAQIERAFLSTKSASELRSSEPIEARRAAPPVEDRSGWPTFAIIMPNGALHDFGQFWPAFDDGGGKR